MKIANEKFLYRKWFLFAVFILFLNDFILKQQFHNTLTGKISDFAGLFAFSYFLSLFTKRVKHAYYFTIVFFIFWKTALSQPSIDFLNSFNLNIYRVVDYSDFIAFLILPISYKYRQERRFPAINTSILTSFGIILTTCFLFVATSQVKLAPPPPQVEQLKLKSNLIVEYPFNEDTFFDSLGYQYNKPFHKNGGYYIFINQNSLFNSLEIIYKINIIESSDSITQVKIDSILNFRYDKFYYYNAKDSIHKTKTIDRLKKMTNKQFDSIFLTKFEKLK